jgi:mono/diheme cytochrome c family protein
MTTKNINPMLKNFFIAVMIFSSAVLFNSCSSGEQNGAKEENESSEGSDNLMKDAETMKDDGKGFGPVKNVVLADAIDEKMAAEGLKLFEAKCTACHKWQKEKYVGPGLMGVTQRRKPEWIMNQILNPLEMTQKDPTAKELFETYLVQMTNQNVTEPEARNMLEYFRKMDSQPTANATGADNATKN